MSSVSGLGWALVIGSVGAAVGFIFQRKALEKLEAEKQEWRDSIWEKVQKQETEQFQTIYKRINKDN